MFACEHPFNKHIPNICHHIYSIDIVQKTLLMFDSFYGTLNKTNYVCTHETHNMYLTFKHRIALSLLQVLQTYMLH